MQARSGTGHPPGSPTFAVVICAFTAERLVALAESIRSLEAQSRPAAEIVLVIDHAPALLEECRRRWPGIRVVPNRETPGLSGARNTGVAETTADLIAFIDDDAVAAPDWLERLADVYADPAVAAAGGEVRPLWLEGRPAWFPPEFDWVVGCTHSGMPKERQAVRNLVGANMSFRRSALAAAGGFRRELGRVGTKPVGCEETDLCIRVRGGREEALVVYEPAAVVEHLVPPARATLRYFAARCAAEGRSKAVLALLAGHGAGLESERAYTRRTLPAGFLRGLRDAMRGDPSGLARAGTLMAGLMITSAGFAASRGVLRGTRARSPQPGDALRILMVTPRSPLLPGGVERHVMEVSRRLVAEGNDVTVLCAEVAGEAQGSELRDGVAIRSVRAWPRGRDWRFAPAIWREMGRGQWDLVHVQSYHTFVAPLAMLRALRLGVPYVVTFHAGGHSSRLRHGIRRLQRTLLRPLLARADRLVAVARFEVDTYGRELRVRADRFALIPNGTDLPRAAEAPGAGSGNGDGGVVLATIGRLERYKGHHRVIEAMPHVLEHEPQASLLVVGTGPYEGDLRDRATALGLERSVEFTSVPANDPEAMAALLGRTSLVVLLSDFETHPLTALEAAAAGRRLLVADRGGLAELADDGYATAVDPDADAPEVGAAILGALAAPPPQGVPPLTSWDESAAALLDLYRSVALHHSMGFAAQAAGTN